jgi:hypothetical protein
MSSALGTSDAPVESEPVRCAGTDGLRARVAELEERLRCVTAERDEALARIELLRGAEYGSLLDSGLPRGRSTGALDEGSCRACEGEGELWVHDFRMDCKRCGGTGRVPNQ